ncbi:MAG: hypothetical protein ACLSAF_12120 [Intestinimonas sp.]
MLHACAPRGSFTLGSLDVETFPTLHDAAEPMGYAVSCGEQRGRRGHGPGLCLDQVRAGMAGAGLVVVECNHDPDWVASSSYPCALKRRILGDHGHLSNEAGGALARDAVATAPVQWCSHI